MNNPENTIVLLRQSASRIKLATESLIRNDGIPRKESRDTVEKCKDLLLVESDSFCDLLNRLEREVFPRR